MDIILHLGAHRTATTSFQHYLRANAAGLGAAGIGVWGPETTRDGLLAGVIPPRGSRPAMAQLTRARGRVGLRLERMRAALVRAQK